MPKELKELKSVNKYPYISRFVDAMENINAHEYVTSTETDFKSLFIFFKLYVDTCRVLKENNTELSKENIDDFMQMTFDEYKNVGKIHKLLEKELPSLEYSLEDDK